MENLFLLALTAILFLIPCTNGLSPILIVPGMRGSKLEAKISDKSECDTNGTWETYWIRFNQSLDCVNNVATLQYDDATDTYSNLPGYEVRTVGFGMTESVQYLDDDKTVSYFGEMVEYFTSKGYIMDSTIRSAPYDWRMAPGTLERTGYYRNVKHLIETMFFDGTNTKVTIVAHGMGGPVILYLLNNLVTQAWKNHFIHAFIPLSGAWSGDGNRGLLTFVSNIPIRMNYYVKLLNTSYPTMESAVWFLPSPSVWEDKVILTTNNKTVNYSANQYKELFTAINREKDFVRWSKTVSINKGWPAPNVATFCYYGVTTKNSTPEVFNFGYDFPKSYHNASFGAGDGAVNLLNLEICLRWKDQQKHHHFSSEVFPYDNSNIIRHSKILDRIKELVSASIPIHTEVQNLTCSINEIFVKI